MRQRIRPILCAVVAVAILALLGISATAPVPPPKPVPIAAPPPVPIAAPVPETQAEPVTPPAPPEPAPLPEVTLKVMPEHSIPEDAGNTAHDRNVSPEVAFGASRVPLPSAPKQFSGTGKATGPAALEIGKVPVQLFGVKSPPSHERCGLGDGADCATAAQRALATHLKPGAQIYCHVPSPKPGIVVAFAICLDADGVDLGGWLVSEGLALADTGQSYDYAGAESIARGQKRGLWGFR
jgi:endonuclease YncB( thermonuclease family)